MNFKHIDILLNGADEIEAAELAVSRIEGIVVGMAIWSGIESKEGIAQSFVGFPRVVLYDPLAGVLSVGPDDVGHLIEQLTEGVEDELLTLDDSREPCRIGEIVAAGKRIAAKLSQESNKPA